MKRADFGAWLFLGVVIAVLLLAFGYTLLALCAEVSSCHC